MYKMKNFLISHKVISHEPYALIRFEMNDIILGCLLIQNYSYKITWWPKPKMESVIADVCDDKSIDDLIEEAKTIYIERLIELNFQIN